MIDGMIELDSDFGKKIGFTTDKFENSWLWKKGDYIYISMIISKKKREGNFSSMIKKIEELGFGIKIPTPSNIMKYYAQKHGFKRIDEYDEEQGVCEIWVKEPIGIGDKI